MLPLRNAPFTFRVYHDNDINRHMIWIETFYKEEWNEKYEFLIGYWYVSAAGSSGSGKQCRGVGKMGSDYGL
jgi:hypothetical protein